MSYTEQNGGIDHRPGSGGSADLSTSWSRRNSRLWWGEFTAEVTYLGATQGHNDGLGDDWSTRVLIGGDPQGPGVGEVVTGGQTITVTGSAIVFYAEAARPSSSYAVVLNVLGRELGKRDLTSVFTVPVVVDKNPEVRVAPDPNVGAKVYLNGDLVGSGIYHAGATAGWSLWFSAQLLSD